MHSDIVATSCHSMHHQILLPTPPTEEVRPAHVSSQKDEDEAGRAEQTARHRIHSKPKRRDMLHFHAYATNKKTQVLGAPQTILGILAKQKNNQAMKCEGVSNGLVQNQGRRAEKVYGIVAKRSSRVSSPFEVIRSIRAEKMVAGKDGSSPTQHQS